MRELELEIAGEFFVMAATLIRIKAQMLLPRRSSEDEEEEDPREELVKNLLEYRRFKEAAHHLAQREEERRKIFTRPSIRPLNLETYDEDPGITVFDLIDAFRSVIENLREEPIYTIERETIRIEEKIDLIMNAIHTRGEILFSELFSGRFSKQDIIVTFLAILELVRLGEIQARQMNNSSDIWLYRKKVVGL